MIIETRNQSTETRMSDFKFDFENLKAYQKSLEFIDKIFGIYKKLDSQYTYSIGSNLIRAGLSIANNLAEGNGKQSKRERKRYFNIASDSARECVSVINVLKRQRLIEDNLYHEIRIDAREITSIIRGLIDSQ